MRQVHEYYWSTVVEDDGHHHITAQAVVAITSSPKTLCNRRVDRLFLEPVRIVNPCPECNTLRYVYSENDQPPG